MSTEVRKQDWTILDLKPGADPAEVERAYRRRRHLYEQGALATYTLLTEKERGEMLTRIEQAYARITGTTDADDRTDRTALRAVDSPAADAGGHPEQGSEPAGPPRISAHTSTDTAAASATKDGLSGIGLCGDATNLSGDARSPNAGPSPAARAGQITALKPVDGTPADIPDEPEPNLTTSPGAFLRYHRRLSGKSRAEIAEETKIRATLLEYLETECLDKLPARVYVRGFVIQYAQSIGLADPEGIARSYLDRIQATDPTWS